MASGDQLFCASNGPVAILPPPMEARDSALPSNWPSNTGSLMPSVKPKFSVAVGTITPSTAFMIAQASCQRPAPFAPWPSRSATPCEVGCKLLQPVGPFLQHRKRLAVRGSADIQRYPDMNLRSGNGFLLPDRIPLFRGAIAHIAQYGGAAGHAVNELVGQKPQGARGQIKRMQCHEGKTDIQGNLWLFDGSDTVLRRHGPSLGGGNARAQTLNEAPAGRRVVYAEKHMPAERESEAAIGAMDVALDVGEIELHARYQPMVGEEMSPGVWKGDGLCGAVAARNAPKRS